MKTKKPNYRYLITIKGKAIINQETGLPYCFEYIAQCNSFIYKNFGETRAFKIKKIK